MQRRDFLLSTAAGALMTAAFSRTANAEGKMMMPWEWTDKNGLTNFLKTDTSPLEDEFGKYPRCPYCGMARKKWSHSRHLIVYEDDMVDGTCSLHCAAISLALNMDRGPKTIYAGDAGAEEEIKPLVDVANATYVIAPKKMGTMTATSKWVYADKAKAEAAATDGATIADFDNALRFAYADMAEDTIRIRKRRAEKRAKMKK